MCEASEKSINQNQLPILPSTSEEAGGYSYIVGGALLEYAKGVRKSSTLPSMVGPVRKCLQRQWWALCLSTHKKKNKTCTHQLHWRGKESGARFAKFRVCTFLSAWCALACWGWERCTRAALWGARIWFCAVKMIHHRPFPIPAGACSAKKEVNEALLFRQGRFVLSRAASAFGWMSMCQLTYTLGPIASKCEWGAKMHSRKIGKSDFVPFPRLCDVHSGDVECAMALWRKL